MDATTTITAEPGATFTLSSFAHPSGEEVGPRRTFRRTPAEDVQAGDALMDAFGEPSLVVLNVTRTARTVRVLTPYGFQTFTRAEVLNVFVSSQDVRPSFEPGVTPLDAL